MIYIKITSDGTSSHTVCEKRELQRIIGNLLTKYPEATLQCSEAVNHEYMDADGFTHNEWSAGDHTILWVE